jgi:integrase
VGIREHPHPEIPTPMLNEIQVSRAKPCEHPYKLTDGDGMHLLIQPTGSKLWRLAYRFGGKQKTLALGVYDKVSLKEARRLRDEARRQLHEGIDPCAKRKTDKLCGVAVNGNSFKEVAEELLAKRAREGVAPITLTKKRRLLAFAYPILGDRPIGQITTSDLLAVLKTVEAREIYQSARRLRSLCGEVFRYAMATRRAEHDLSADLRGALISPKVKHHAALVEPKEVGGLVRAIDNYHGYKVTRLALTLALLLFPRPGELRAAEWSEIDLEGAMWRIPASRMKMKRPHQVPLSRQAIEILKELREITGYGRFLFPAIDSPLRPMSENVLNTSLRRMGFTKQEQTAHGLRSTASTSLNELGFRADLIEKQLAHEERNGVRAAYNSAEYMPERITMMQRWADYLDSLR